MPKCKTIRVVLSGGLGNQLFQYAFALAASKNLDCPILLSKGLGVARQRIPGQADLEFYNLESSVQIENPRQLDNLRRKCLNFLHTRSLKNDNKFLSVLPLNRILAHALISFVDSKPSTIFSASDLGYVGTCGSKPYSYFIGYFQTFRYLLDNALLNELRSLKIRNVGPELNQLVHDSKTEKPLIIHVRLTDYIEHSAFGILGMDYYAQAFDEVRNNSDFKKVWIFSDDLKLAQSVLPDSITRNARFIGEVDNSPVATLEAMRLGRHYIIANSTFSWWAAMLSENQSANVIAPAPWFYEIAEPVDLIPPIWKRIAR